MLETKTTIGPSEKVSGSPGCLSRLGGTKPGDQDHPDTQTTFPRFAWMVCAGLMAVGLSAQSRAAEPENVNQTLAQASAERAGGRLLKAEELFLRVLSSVSVDSADPSPSTRQVTERKRIRRICLSELASVARELGNRDDALRYALEYRESLQAEHNPLYQPYLQESALEIASDHIALGNYSEAQAVLKGLLDEQYGPPKALNKLQCLLKLGTVETVTGRVEAARSHWTAARTLAADLIGDEAAHLPLPAQIFCVTALIRCDDAVGENKQADRRLDLLIKQLQRTPNPALQTGRILLDLATDAFMFHNFVRAEHYLRQALETSFPGAEEQGKDGQSKDSSSEVQTVLQARLLQMLGHALIAQGRTTKAVDAWDRAAELYEQLAANAAQQSDGDVNQAAYWKQLRSLYRQMGRLQQAVRAGERLFQIRQRDLGEQHPLTVDAEMTLGSLYGLLGDYTKAKRHLDRTVEFWQARKQTAPLELARVLNNLAAVERALGNYNRAIELFEQSLQMRKRHLPADDPDLAMSYINLAAVLVAKGRYARAITLCKNVEQICRSRGDRADDLLSEILLNLGKAYQAQGQYQKAYDDLAESLVLRQKVSGVRSLESVQHYLALAELFRSAGYQAEAYQLIQQSLEICERENQTDRPIVATLHYNLGMLAFHDNAYETAETHWQQALAVQQRHGQKALAARTVNNLGVLDFKQGHFDEARQKFERALAVQQAIKARPQEEYQTLCNLAALLHNRGDTDEALRLTRQAMDLTEAPRTETWGAEYERAYFLFERFESALAFDLHVSMSVEAGRLDEAFLAAERGRNRTFLDQLNLAGIDLRETLPSEARDLLSREKQLRETIHRLRAQRDAGQSTSDAQDVTEQLSEQLAQAQRDYFDVWKSIRNASPFYRKLLTTGNELWSLADVRDKIIAPRELMLCYYLGSAQSYVFAIGPANGEVTAYPLSIPEVGISEQSAEQFANLVDEQQPLGARGLTGTVTTEKGERIVDQMERLPVESGPFTRSKAAVLVGWYLTALRGNHFDAARGLVGITESTKGDEAVAVMTALADVLLPEPLRKHIAQVDPSELMIVPDGALHGLPFEALLLRGGSKPQFALDVLPPVAYAPSANILARLVQRSAPDRRALRRLLTVGNPVYKDLPPLPGTADECKRIIEAFSGSGRSVVSLLGTNATEGNVASNIKGCGLVHIAAHGLIDEQYENLFGRIALTPPVDPQSSQNDGYLSYNEILDLPLSNCELAVLSACRTNVGPRRPLEAANSLAQVFLAAGARRVVASHWSVSDVSTAELMAEFFEDLVAQRRRNLPLNYAQALHQAKRRVRNDPRWTAPYYWAPFVLVGPATGSPASGTP